VFGSLACAQGSASVRPPAPEAFDDKLRKLSPESPLAYFLLGEEVADASQDVAGRRLAATLFVLAFELDRAQEQGGRLAANACTGLAAVTRDGKDRRWLLALARTLDPRYSPPEWVVAAPPMSQDSEAYRVATLLGLVRAGEGGRAKHLIARAEVKSALAAYDVLLSRLGVGSVSGIVREAERWPCPECSNDRVLKTRSRQDGFEHKVCFHCAGNPGPQLTRADLLAQLRFESWVLQGVQRSWAAQISTDEGAPLVDPEPEGVALVFGVDAKAVYWRNGRWCRTADGLVPAEPPMPRLRGRRPPKPDEPAPAEGSTPDDSGSSGS